MSRPGCPPVELDQTSTTIPDDHMAIVGYNDISKGVYTVVSMATQKVVFKGRRDADNPSPTLNSVLYHGHHYLVLANRLCVRDPNTDEVVNEIVVTSEENTIEGMQTFDGEVYYYTREEVFVLDADGLACTQLAQLDHSSRCPLKAFQRFVIMSRDNDELTIAAIFIEASELRAVTFSIDTKSFVKSSKLQDLPKDLTLVGFHGGHAYFHTSKTPPFYYVCFKGNSEVKRAPVDDCQKLLQCNLCHGLLYLLYQSLEDNQTLYITCVDLNTDRTLFRRSCNEWVMRGVGFFIPVIEAHE